MQRLELSACCLQANHLVQIAESVADAPSLMVLDLSENVLSELVPENNARLAQFLCLLSEYLLSTKTLHSLNLQGLLLGSKLLPFLDTLEQNKTLMQVNLSKNLITKDLEQKIERRMAAHNLAQAALPFQHQLMGKYDSCFHETLATFKHQHAALDSHNVAARAHKDANLAFSAMLNSKLDADLRKSLSAQQKLSTHHATGEIFGNMGAAKTRTLQGQDRVDPTVDRVFLRRNIGFSEMVFNEFGRDLIAEFDYDKPNRWNVMTRDPRSPTWLGDINESQYVMVHINLDTIGDDFERVDRATMEVLRSHYSLDVFESWKSGFSPTKARERESAVLDQSPGSVYSALEPLSDEDSEYHSSVK